MLFRAMVVWFGILVLASLNGALRDLVVAPRVGDTIARAISTLILCGLIALVTWYAIRWIGPHGSVILEDYNVLRGRIWVLVPLVTFLAPSWAARMRGLWRA